MLIPEIKEALKWLKEVQANLGANPTTISDEDLKRLDDAGTYLDGARHDCEQSLDALDAVGHDEGGISNPIAHLSLHWDDGSDMKAAKEAINMAILALDDNDGE